MPARTKDLPLLNIVHDSNKIIHKGALNIILSLLSKVDQP